MTSVTDVLTIHQLLGRIVYFHALFIEPALPPGSAADAGDACCNHGTAPGRRTAGELLAGTAWAALADVAATLPAYHRACPEAGGACCVTCVVVSAGAAIATGWAQAEHWAYHGIPPAGTLVHCTSRTVAGRLGRSFAGQYGTGCPALARLCAVPAGEDALPGLEELPLTGELLALWADPGAATRHPVASWLNHCTGLDDVRRVLRTRRTGP